MLAEVYFRIKKYEKTRSMLKLARKTNSKLKINVFKDRIEKHQEKLSKL